MLNENNSYHFNYTIFKGILFVHSRLGGLMGRALTQSVSVAWYFSVLAN